MAGNTLNSSLLELHIRNQQPRSPRFHVGSQVRPLNHNNKPYLRDNNYIQRAQNLEPSFTLVSDHLLQQQLQIQQLEREIQLHKAQLQLHKHPSVARHSSTGTNRFTSITPAQSQSGGTIVDWGIDDDFEMSVSSGSTTSTIDENTSNLVKRYHHIYNRDWTNEDEELTHVDPHESHFDINAKQQIPFESSSLDGYLSNSVTLKDVADQTIGNYTESLINCDQLIQSTIEKLKYDIIASSIMNDDRYRDTTASLSIMGKDHKIGFNLQNTIFINEFNQLPYYSFVYSFKVIFLARSLIRYAKSKCKTRKNKQLLVLISLSLINLYSKAKEVILKLFLQAIKNRIEKFILCTDNLDYFVNKSLRSIKSYENKFNNLYRPSYSHHSNPAYLKANKLLVTSILNTLMITFNLRIKSILPFTIPEFLEEYFTVYQLDIVNDPKNELKFINMLNQCDPYDAGYQDEGMLKPLKLRSVSASATPTMNKMEFEKTRHSNQLLNFKIAEDMNSLLKFVKSIRKIFMCIILSILESFTKSTINPANSPAIQQDYPATNDSPNRSRFFYDICTKKFGMDSRNSSSTVHFTKAYLPTMTKLYLLINLFNALTPIISNYINELNDYQTLNNLKTPKTPHDDANNNYDYSDILEEDRSLNSKLINSMDQLSNKLSYLEMSKNTDQLDNLLVINEDLNNLLELYKETITTLETQKSSEETSRRILSLKKFKPFISSPLAASSSSNGQTTNQDHAKKRHSSGLNFNLVKVVESENEVDTEFAEFVKNHNETMMLSADEGVRYITSDDKIDGVLNKEELARALEKLNGLDNDDHETNLSSSTPRASVDLSALADIIEDDINSDTVVITPNEVDEQVHPEIMQGLGLTIPQNEKDSHSLITPNQAFQQELNEKLFQATLHNQGE